MGNFRVRTNFVFLVYLCTNKEIVVSARFFSFQSVVQRRISAEWSGLKVSGLADISIHCHFDATQKYRKVRKKVIQMSKTKVSN